MAYKDSILADNPYAYYRLDEASGASGAIDSSGHGYNGKYLDDTEITFSKPGLLTGDSDTAIELTPATPQTVMCGVLTPLTSMGSDLLSAEAWIEIVALPSAGGMAAIIGNGKNTDATTWTLYLNSSGRLCAQYNNGGGGFLGIYGGAGPLLPSGTTVHVVFTYDGAVGRLYVNGNLTNATSSSPGPITMNGQAFRIGHRYRDSGVDPTTADSFFGVIDEVALYNYALTPAQVYSHYLAGIGQSPTQPTYEVAGDDRHYFAVQIWDSSGSQLLDIPQADIESLDFEDIINGGSGQGTLVFRRDFNNIGQAAFLNRVLVWFWHGGIARPTDPYYAGYMLEPDQEAMRTTGKITWHLEGDAKQLDRGIVSENINPLVSGNGNLDAADYIRHLLSLYAPPGFAAYSVPSAMFPLLPLQFSRQKLGSVLDTVIKTGRDDVGQIWTWRVRSNYQLRRTFLVQPDQNPNKISGPVFKHIFKEGMCAAYKIETKYRDLVNVVLVEGARDPGTGQAVSEVAEDDASVSAYGAFEDAITVPSLVNSDACKAYGEAYLDMHANPSAQGEVELWTPDPSIVAGTWIQTWETASVIKQMRVGSVKVSIKPTRVVQTLSPTAPTPYLDEAVYKMGMHVQGAISSMQRGLATNTQQNYVRLGGSITAGP